MFNWYYGLLFFLGALIALLVERRKVGSEQQRGPIALKARRELRPCDSSSIDRFICSRLALMEIEPFALDVAAHHVNPALL